MEARRPGRRRRGAARAPARRLLPRHGRQLRVPRLLALLPGRQHRVRGARHRDHGHDAASPRASSRPTARSSTSAPTRRSTSTSSSRGSTWTSTATTTRSHMTESEALPIGPDNPHGLALVQRSVPLRTEQEGKQDYDWPTQRAWKVVNPRRDATGSARRSPTSSCPARAFPADDRPVARRCCRRAQVIGHTLWVTPYARDERWPCGEFVEPERARTTGLPVWTAAEPLDREHRRRALVRLRHPPRHARRGLAGHAGRHGVVLAQAVRLLRPQPGARRRPVHGACRRAP